MHTGALLCQVVLVMHTGALLCQVVLDWFKAVNLGIMTSQNGEPQLVS